MSNQKQLVEELTSRYPSAEVTIFSAHSSSERTDGTGELTVFGERGGLVRALAAGLHPMFQWMEMADVERLVFLDDARLEVIRDLHQAGMFTVKQRWEDGLETQHVMAWTSALPKIERKSTAMTMVGTMVGTETFSQKSLPLKPGDTETGLLEPNPSDQAASGKITSTKSVVSEVSWRERVRALSPRFCDYFETRAPYIVGAMAGGISSVSMISAASKEGYLGFFGSGGLSIQGVASALEELSELSGVWGCNLLHNPMEPQIEEQTVDVFLQCGVQTISASAYMRLSAALVRYRVLGLEEKEGQVHCRHRVFAKVSHPSVIAQFLQPPPEKLLQSLLEKGQISAKQAQLASKVPMADAITLEADSGGHTDRRPLSILLPIGLKLRDDALQQHAYSTPIFVGAAGGIAEPRSIRGAFAMGADYVLLGSVHQCTREAGTSDLVKEMLAEVDFVDCAMGAAPDMFEQGAQVQVLKKGSMYASRSMKLSELYKQFDSWEAIPLEERSKVETQIFQKSYEAVWQETVAYWQRDPTQIEKAAKSSKHKMALVFRWYLGQSSRWARQGLVERKRDFQIWCGPSMGAFNRWVKGSPLESWKERGIVPVIEALLKSTVSDS